MRSGTVILIPFPFAEITDVKIRPAVIIAVTKDKYQDIIICAISSVTPTTLSENEILINSSITNSLKVNSIIKVDRIVTLKQKDIIDYIGYLTTSELALLKVKFHNLFP